MNGVRVAFRHRSLATFWQACALLCMSGCALDGAAEFRQSQRAVQKLDRITIEWATTTTLGVFTETAEFDCGLRYYRYRYVKDLSAKGVEDGVTLSQGRPRAHQVEERLFTGGRSWTRFSGAWEDPKNDNAHDWVGASSSYDPVEECTHLHEGQESRFVPFKRILQANAIQYKGVHIVDGVLCHEYVVTYPEAVYTDRMKTVQLGPGSSYSERETATRPVQSRIFVGVRDVLPRRAVKGDLTVKFSYGAIVPVPNPART